MGYYCPYATDWAADKTLYQPSVDPGEQAALCETPAECSDVPITATLAH
ncbi:hypothetical protein ACFW93_08915 [Streptomyces canus]